MDQGTDNNGQPGAQQPPKLTNGQPATALERGQVILLATRDLLNTLAESDKAKVSEVLDRIKSLAKAFGF